jgi:hypothetical protein
MSPSVPSQTTFIEVPDPMSMKKSPAGSFQFRVVQDQSGSKTAIAIRRYQPSARGMEKRDKNSESELQR